jgi:3alpha(or 20beta)-hydroxysteroid dehydrogenase
MGRLQGKCTLITGAGGGQGRAEAKLFAEEGAILLLTGLPGDGHREAASEIRASGGRAFACDQDVADEAQWIRVVETAAKDLGGLHVFVNNAGTINRKGIVDTTLDGWNRTMAVNLTGAMLGMKHVAPLMRDSGGGSIINVSSIAGLGPHYDAAYCASKWGLRGLTKTASIEFVDWKIRVNSIHPGQISDTSFFTEGLPGHSESARRSIPMQRQGTPLECAHLVLFLGSDESSFITGAEIAIDGGFSGGAAVWMRNRIRERLAAGAEF